MTLTVSSSQLYDEYKSTMQKIADVKNAAAVLQWDQETYLPEKGNAGRSRQIATLSEAAHELFTADRLGDLLRELSARQDLPALELKNVQLTWEDFSKQKKFSSAFVRKMSECISKSYHAWVHAKKESRFSLFESDLQELITLKKEEASLLGYLDHPYDALLNEFEKGATVTLLDKTFGTILTPLKNLLEKITACQQVDDSFLFDNYPKQRQWDFGMALIGRLGFDFDAGRQDISEHPFTTSFNSNDVRITTRINENDFGSMTWSCIHEVGHALYEQGLPAGEYGLPSGEYASLGIHESQSRLWENNVGRSLGFWKFQYSLAQQYFPGSFGERPLFDFYKAINKVQPSLIRTEADELTYHFHVMIRYELEKLLIEGSLSARDIPEYWNSQYAKYLGVTVPDDRRGCLQDVHWSHGSFGYFPTYSLGSLYAAQLFAAARQKVPGVQEEIENGNTGSLLRWLREEIHQKGRTYTSEELCFQATGEFLDIRHFMDYLLDKYKNIYNF